MHLSEGVLHLPILIIGAVGALIGTTIGLKKLTDNKLTLTALFSAVFFVASTIHVPVGIGSVHLILNGLAGLFLGWSVFPAFLIALTLQALLFSFGGLTVLGVNLCIMALPAVILHYLFRYTLTYSTHKLKLSLIGGLCGIVGVGGAAILASLVLAIDGGKDYFHLIGLLFLTHIPIFIVDSIISAVILIMLIKMKSHFLPEVLSR